MQISFSVNNFFSLFLCLQLLCLISPFSSQCVRVCERAWGGGAGVVSNLSCNMQYFHINFSFCLIFPPTFPPLISPTNWKKIPPYDASPMFPPTCPTILLEKPNNWRLFDWPCPWPWRKCWEFKGEKSKRFDLFIHPHWNQWALSGVMTQPSLSSATFLPQELHTLGAPPTIRGPSTKRTVVRNMELSC